MVRSGPHEDSLVKFRGGRSAPCRCLPPMLPPCSKIVAGNNYASRLIGIRRINLLISAMPSVSQARALGSGAGGHVGGQDVVRVAVKVLACSVVTHRGPRVSGAGSDLDVSQIHAGIEHSGDKSMAKHVRVRPGDPHSGGF